MKSYLKDQFKVFLSLVFPNILQTYKSEKKLCLFVCVCTCVCVCEREREGEGEREKERERN